MLAAVRPSGYTWSRNGRWAMFNWTQHWKPTEALWRIEVAREGGGKNDIDVSQDLKVVTFRAAHHLCQRQLECLFEEGSFRGHTQTRPSRTSGDGPREFVF